jgi:hypothetical protein
VEFNLVNPFRKSSLDPVLDNVNSVFPLALTAEGQLLPIAIAVIWGNEEIGNVNYLTTPERGLEAAA